MLYYLQSSSLGNSPESNRRWLFGAREEEGLLVGRGWGGCAEVCGSLSRAPAAHCTGPAQTRWIYLLMMNALPQFLLRFCFCLCGTEPLEAAAQLTHKHTPTDQGGGAPQRVDDSTAQCWENKSQYGCLESSRRNVFLHFSVAVVGTKTPVACFSVYSSYDVNFCHF